MFTVIFAIMLLPFYFLFGLLKFLFIILFVFTTFGDNNSTTSTNKTKTTTVQVKKDRKAEEKRCKELKKAKDDAYWDGFITGAILFGDDD